MTEKRKTGTAGFRDTTDVFHTARDFAEKDRIHRQTVENALRLGFIGGIMGFLANSILQRMVPFYARRPRIFKILFTISFPISGFVIGGEQGGLELEREYGAQKSYVKVKGMKYLEQEEKVEKGPITLEDIKTYVITNKFKVASVTWLSLIIGSGVMLWANPKVPPAQKVIHARMIAQGAVLSSLLGMAAFGAKDVAPPQDSELERINKRYFQEVLSGDHGITAGTEVKQETRMERTQRLCNSHVMNWKKCLDGRPALDENGLPIDSYCVDSLMKMVDCVAPKVVKNSDSTNTNTPLATSLFKQLQLCTKSVMSTGQYSDPVLGTLRDCSEFRQKIMVKMKEEGWRF